MSSRTAAWGQPPVSMAWVRGVSGVCCGRIGLGWWGVGVVNLDAFGRESVVLGEELGVFSTSTARNISERRADVGGGIEVHTA